MQQSNDDRDEGEGARRTRPRVGGATLGAVILLGVIGIEDDAGDGTDIGEDKPNSDLIDDRSVTIEAVTARLAAMDAFEDVSQVPIRHLTDAQLQARRDRIEADLKSLQESDTEGDHDALTDPADVEVLRHLDALDYLIENPDATLPAYWALDEESSRWHERFVEDAAARACPDVTTESTTRAEAGKVP